MLLQQSPTESGLIEKHCGGYDGDSLKQDLHARRDKDLTGLVGGKRVPKESERLEVIQAIDVAIARNSQRVVLTTGGKCESYAMQMMPGAPDEEFIQMGDFV